MKRIFTLILACFTALGCASFAACKINENDNDDKISAVCTIFPLYDWTKNIIGDEQEKYDLTFLIDGGVDFHSYQPSVQDIAKISTCDLFIYVGGESDAWVDNALKNATNKDIKVINLLEVLGDKVKTEEAVEGMEHEHDDDHDHEEDHDGEHGEEEYDEHVWLSLRNAAVCCKEIASAIKGLDEERADSYENNLAAYREKLTTLDKNYSTAVSNAKYNTLVFGDRFPFRYLADDYGLKYYAAFSGCSAETEASFETIIFLAGKIDELKLPAVCTIEGSSHKIAEQVKNNTTAKNQKVVTFDSMQSVTAKDVENGVSYISIMQNNLNALKNALN